MKRTAYFNDTKPGQDQLNYTETSRVNAILERARAFSQFGVLSGFRVIVNGLNTTRIDIGVGEGFTGGHYQTSDLKGTNSGERIATNDGSFTVTASSLALADYTNGAINYVTLLFEESTSAPLTERDYPGTSHDTLYAETFTASVLTAAAWAALTTVQKQSRILVALVTARGVGVALSSTDIEQTVQPMTHPIGTQPTNITGVTVEGISQGTPTGTATLSYIAASKALRFTAPGDTAGTSVPINSSGEYTVYSNTVAYYIVVDVVYALLPIANQTDTLSITSLYGREIPLASGVDTAHRDLVGTGLVSAVNAHGLSLSDIQGGALSHADLFHRNGITYEADATQLGCTILPATDSVEVVNLGGTSNTFLIDGAEHETIVGYNAGTSGQISFTGELTNGEFLIYLDSNAGLQRVLLAEYVGGKDYVLWDDNIKIYDMFNMTAGTGSISWNSTTKVLTYRSPADNGGVGYGPDVYINALWGDVSAGYYKLYSGGLIDWVIVHIAGDIGVTNSSSFAITKAETVVPDDAILKLCVVTWRADHGNLVAGSLRDIRSFLTADNTPELQEEHDVDGRHTKELRNQLRIGVENNAFQAIVETSSAGFFQARSGSIALSVSAPNSAAVVAASRNAAAYVYGAVASVSNNQNDAAAIPVGVYGFATNTATALGIGVWGSGGGIGVQGNGESIGVSASGGTYGVVASCPTAYYGNPIPGTFNSFFGIQISASTAAAIAKTVYAVLAATLNYAGAGASVKSAYGVVNVMDLSWATENVGFYNAVMNSSNAGVYYGMFNFQKASAVDSKMIGFNNLVDASTVVSHQCGVSQYVYNSETCSLITGINQTIVGKNATNIYGIYNENWGNAVAGQVITANAQRNYVSVRNPDVIRGYWGVAQAVYVANVIQGIENTIIYETAATANGAVIHAAGINAVTAYGLNVSNVISTSCGATALGIKNELRYTGIAFTPAVVRGLDTTMVVSRGLDVEGCRVLWDVASASLLVGFGNPMTAATAQSMYGFWNSVANGDANAASSIYGIYTTVHGGAAGQNLCIGADITATGVVAGTVYGVVGTAENENNPGQAVGVWGRGWPAALGGGNLGYGVVGFGQNYGVWGSGIIGIFGTGDHGVNATGASYGGYFRGNSIGVFAYATVSNTDVTGGVFSASNSISGGVARGIQGNARANDPGDIWNPSIAVGVYGSASMNPGFLYGAVGVSGFAADIYGIGVKGSAPTGVYGIGSVGGGFQGTATGARAYGPVAVYAYGTGGGNIALELAQGGAGPLIRFGTAVKGGPYANGNCYISCYVVETIAGAPPTTVTHLTGFIPVCNVILT